LLDGVAEEAERRGQPFVSRTGKTAMTIRATRRGEIDRRQPEALRLQSGEANVVGGTAWLWSRRIRVGVDVPFVDEAGQMSLANVIAVSQAASSVVLLAIRSSSSSREKEVIPTESTRRRWSTSSMAAGRFPRNTESFFR
jgi:hypothetical protein